MKQTLRFQELLPERDDFELEDGTKVSFLSRAEMTASQIFQLDELLSTMIKAGKRLAKKPKDRGAQKQILEAQDRTMLLILPEIPGETLARLKVVQKTQILDWWRKRQLEPPGETKAPEAPASRG